MRIVRKILFFVFLLTQPVVSWAFQAEQMPEPGAATNFSQPDTVRPNSPGKANSWLSGLGQFTLPKLNFGLEMLYGDGGNPNTYQAPQGDDGLTVRGTL